VLDLPRPGQLQAVITAVPRHQHRGRLAGDRGPRAAWLWQPAGHRPRAGT